MSPRSQSATEFLTTYGLMFFIVAIGIALLLIFAKAPSQTLPTSCSIYGTLSCSDVAYGYNSVGASTLVVLASLQQQGQLNVSSFNAVAGGIKSTSGYCSINGVKGGPTLISEGQIIYCYASFPTNVLVGQTYVGTFNITGNYCGVAAKSCSSKNPTYSFTGSFRTQGTSNVLITTTSIISSTSTSTTTSTSTSTSSSTTASTTTTTSTIQPCGTGGGNLYVSLLGTGKIDVVNTITNQMSNVISFGASTDPGSVTAVSPSGSYVYTENSTAFFTISTSTNKVVNTIALPASQTHSIIISPDGTTAYLSATGNVMVINLISNKVSNTIPVTGGAYFSALTPGGMLYTDGGSSNIISVISTSTNKVISTIALPPYVPGTGGAGWSYASASGQLGYYLPDINVSPDGKYVYVLGYMSLSSTLQAGLSTISTSTQQVTNTINIPTMIGIYPNWPLTIGLSPDGGSIYIPTENEELMTISTATSTVTNTIMFSHQPGNPYIFSPEVVVSPDSKNVYLLSSYSYGGSSNGLVTTINSATNQFTNVMQTLGSPLWLTMSPDGSTGYTNDYFYNSISVINLQSNSLAATVTVGAHPFYSVLACPGAPSQPPPQIPTTGALYLSALPVNWQSGNAITSGNFITVNTVTNQVANIITFNGVTPYAMVISPDNRYAYVENLGGSGGCGGSICPVSFYGGNSISVVDLTADNVIATVYVPGEEAYGSYDAFFDGMVPEPIILSPDGSKLYVGYIGSGSSSLSTGLGYIAVISTSSYSVVNTIFLGGTATTPGQLAISIDGKTLYVAGDDWAGPPNVKVVSTVTNAVTATIPCVHGGCMGVLMSPNKRLAYVTSQSSSLSNAITVINTTTQTTNTVYGPSTSYYDYPPYLAFTPDSGYAYVSNFNYGVDVINTATNKVTNTISVPSEFPWQLAIGNSGIADLLTAGATPSNVVAIDTSTNKIIKTTPATVSMPSPTGSQYSMMAISPDATYAYVTGGFEPSVLAVNVQTSNTIAIPINGYPIYIQAAPVIPLAIILSPTSNTVYAGQSVTFTNATAGGTAPYTFSYSTNAVSYTISGNRITFNAPGTYSVVESATDSAGHTAYSQTATITVLVAGGQFCSPSGSVSTWSPTSSYPISIGFPSCTSSNGYIYCVGGVVSGNPVNNVYYANVISSGLGSWMPTNSYPIAITAESCTSSNGYIYCVGGSTASGSGTSAVYSAPLSGAGVGTWKATNSYPYALGDQFNIQSCTSSNGYIYCVGSGYNSNSVYYASLSGGNVGTWTPQTSYPLSNAGWGPSCTSINGYDYCVGGYYSGTGGSGYTANVYYAPLSSGGVGAWTGTTTFPTAWPNLCTSYNGYIYCQGGAPYYASVSNSGVGAWNSFLIGSANANPICIASGGNDYCIGQGTGVSYAPFCTG